MQVRVRVYDGALVNSHAGPLKDTSSNLGSLGAQCGRRRAVVPTG